MATLAEVLRQAGYVTPQGQVVGPRTTTAQTMSNYIRNIIPNAAQNLAQQRADIDAALMMGDQGIQVGDRAAFERQMAQVPNLMGLTAYHGTPHNIKGKFDISKVGTGEGAQAYGHGMYFAENPAVAEGYKNALAGKEQDIINNAIERLVYINNKDTTKIADALRLEGFNVEKITPELEASIKKIVQATDPTTNTVSKAGINEYANLSKLVPKQGNLYKVDIPDEYIPNMLDWDKPLSQQPVVMKALRTEAEQKVKSRVLDNLENEIRSSLPPIDIGNDYMAMFSDANVKAGQEIKKQALEKLKKMDLNTQFEKELESMKPRDMNWNMTGKEFYELMSKNQGSAAKASEFFQRQGVTGIRYLDEGSRARGKGTSNFVVFEPSEVKILEQKSKPLSRKEILEQELKKVVE
jgi:hypothetical protein